MGKTISICLTSYNRDNLVLESFQQVVDDERIGEVVIVDDASDMQFYDSMVKLCSHPKVRIFRNEKNVDCYENKKRSIELASNEFAILFDSDNILTKSYIDKIFEFPWNEKILFQPDFAKPHFNFVQFAGMVIAKNNVGQYMHNSTFSTMLNAMNYFVNRDEYLRVWDGSIDPVTADSIYQNYRWLMFGNEILVLPGLQYEHRIHEGSHYQNNNHRTGHWMKTITDRLKQMK